MFSRLTRLRFQLLRPWRSLYPAYLPTVRPYVLGLAAVLLGLELWNGATPITLLYPLGLCMALLPPPQQWAGLAGILAIALSVWAIPNTIGSVHTVVPLGVIIAASLFGRSHWIHHEWMLAAQSLLATLTAPHKTESSHQALATVIRQMRRITHADAVMLMQQLDDVTAEVILSEPKSLIPNQFTTVTVLAEAIAQQRCVYYQDPDQIAAIAPVLFAKGARTITVMPLLHPDRVVGGIILLWRSPIRPSHHLQTFLSMLGGGISTFLRFQDATLHAETLQARLVAILQTIPQGIVFIDETGAQGWVNATAAEQLHLEQGYVSPLAIAQAMTALRQQADNHDDLTLDAVQHFSQPSASIRDWQWRFSNPQKVLSFSSTPVCQRNTPGRLWVIDDITERCLAEEALRRSEERLRWIVQATNDAVWDWDLTSHHVWRQEATTSSLGFATATGESNVTWWQTHVHPEDQDRVLASLAKVIEQGEYLWGDEYRYRRPDGSYAYVADRGYVIHDAAGRPQRMLGGMTDVTERKEAQAELERQSRRTQLFAEVTLKIRQSLKVSEILEAAVREVQVILQADRVVVYRLNAEGKGQGIAESVKSDWPAIANQGLSAEYLFLNNQPFSLQRGIQQITDIRHDQRLHAQRIESAQHGHVQAELVVPIDTVHQPWGVLIAHQCDRPRNWTAFEVDLLRQLADQIGIALTQAHLLEQETQQRQELTRSNTELQQFAYVASHDLQEPLRMVTSYLQLLEKRYASQLDADAKDFIDYAVDGATRMKRLISDLLSYSRVGTHGRSFEQINSTAALQEAIANLEMAIAETDATVHYGELPWVSADPKQLVQLFQNLIGNAIKFHGDAKPVIEIEATLQDAKWLFTVRDNGIGFEPEYSDRIFVIFQRLHSRSQYPGTGIGLAICKKIVDRHGGMIWAESSPAHGSQFYFTLPDRGEIQHG